jgi:hypothetical protein
MATLGVTAALVRRLSDDRWTLAACLAPVLLASMPSFAGWSVAGLETTFFTLLVTLAIWRFIDEQEQPGALPVSAALLALAGMTRPDGVGVAMLLFGVALVRAMRGHAIVRRAYVTRFVLVFLALAGPYMIWRLAYYGYLLPNTFYVKSTRGVIQWMAGLLYVTAGIRKHGGWLLHLIALLPVLLGPSRLRDRALPVVVVLLGWHGYNVYKGHDVLELFRFFVPVLPITCALGAIGFVRIAEWVRDEVRVPALPAAASVLLVAGTLLTNAVLARMSWETHEQLSEYQVQIRIDDDEFLEHAERLLAIAPPDASIALVDAGVIPYVTGWHTVDRWGLCDVHIAHGEPKGPLGEKYDEAYVLSRAPMFIQTKTTEAMAESGSYGWIGDSELYALPAFREGYVRVPDRVLQRYFVRRDALPRLRLAPALSAQ